MLSRFRKQWRDLRRGKPGHRFEARFEAIQDGGDRPVWGRVVAMIVGVLSFAIGLVLMFIPGPAILFFFVGGMLVATESRTVARFMDWAEVKLRSLFRWTRQRWRNLSHAARAFLVAAVVLIAGTGGYVVFRTLAG